MSSPTTARGLLGHFPQVADPPANDQHATTLPVQSPTSSSLRAISAAGAGGGGRSACWSLAGGSATCGKCPRSPRAIVGDGISRPLLRHLTQQYHPVHCLPAFRHSHARADGPVVEQVECRVQLQHRSTISQDRQLERLTVELVPISPVGVSPFLFCFPDGPAAVDNLDTPPAIARPSLLRSEITAGLSHQELTSLTHSRHPSAHRRPHFHRGVCVCVCVTGPHSVECVQMMGWWSSNLVQFCCGT